ncbi:hypothetical protein LCGC14_0477530 [marine sediment metagenome]|uniref:Uncharacterized protein n=1 Tax=marine sediment metagenome TaxID=412755 RepID=A0A0F9STA9_9ZZZZ
MKKDEYIDLGVKAKEEPVPKPQKESPIQMEEAKEPVDEKGKKKLTWWSKMFKSKNFEKPKLIAVLFLRNNGRAETMQLEAKNGFFNIDKKTYHERKDCTWVVGKDRIPLAIIPEWSLIPLGTQEWQDKPMLEKFNELQDHTLKGIRHAELVKVGGFDTGNFSTKQLILWGLVILVGGIIVANYI